VDPRTSGASRTGIDATGANTRPRRNPGKMRELAGKEGPTRKGGRDREGTERARGERSREREWGPIAPAFVKKTGPARKTATCTLHVIERPRANGHAGQLALPPIFRRSAAPPSLTKWNQHPAEGWLAASWKSWAIEKQAPYLTQLQRPGLGTRLGTWGGRRNVPGSMPNSDCRGWCRIAWPKCPILPVAFPVACRPKVQGANLIPRGTRASTRTARWGGADNPRAGSAFPASYGGVPLARPCQPLALPGERWNTDPLLSRRFFASTQQCRYGSNPSSPERVSRTPRELWRGLFSSGLHGKYNPPGQSREWPPSTDFVGQIQPRRRWPVRREPPARPGLRPPAVRPPSTRSCRLACDRCPPAPNGGTLRIRGPVHPDPLRSAPVSALQTPEMVERTVSGLARKANLPSMWPRAILANTLPPGREPSTNPPSFRVTPGGRGTPAHPNGPHTIRLPARAVAAAPGDIGPTGPPGVCWAPPSATSIRGLDRHCPRCTHLDPRLHERSPSPRSTGPTTRFPATLASSHRDAPAATCQIRYGPQVHGPRTPQSMYGDARTRRQLTFSATTGSPTRNITGITRHMAKMFFVAMN